MSIQNIMISNIRDIDIQTNEGRLLLAALAMLTTESHSNLCTNKTPDEVMVLINELASHMFKDVML